jgi:hypothetical protein
MAASADDQWQATRQQTSTLDRDTKRMENMDLHDGPDKTRCT